MSGRCLGPVELGAGPEATQDVSKERSQRLLKMALGGVHTFLLVTSKIILFIHREKEPEGHLPKVSLSGQL